MQKSFAYWAQQNLLPQVSPPICKYSDLQIVMEATKGGHSCRCHLSGAIRQAIAGSQLLEAISIKHRFVPLHQVRLVQPDQQLWIHQTVGSHRPWNALQLPQDA